jgi:two-component system chemotaxis response regulator CheB
LPSDKHRAHRNIVVIAASAGGVEALRALMAGLPNRFPGTLFCVQHMSREGPGLLAHVLGRETMMPVVVPKDLTPIAPETVYVPWPDHHLVITDDHVNLSRGPMQNRSRPSADVLFRSAALAFGARVVGVVLTGMLDDGSAGLLAIKRRGGTAVVQDPADALHPSMPKSALRTVSVDYCLPLAEIPKLLLRLAGETVSGEKQPPDPTLERERRADEGGPVDIEKIASRPSPFTCPECHGVLWQIDDPDLQRFRCRVGHGYSLQSLLADEDNATEGALWAAVRSLEERAALLRNMADQWRARGGEDLARDLQARAETGDAHAAKIREVILAVNHRR